MASSYADDPNRVLLLSLLQDLQDNLEHIDELITELPSLNSHAVSAAHDVGQRRNKVAALLEDVTANARRARVIAGEWASEALGRDPAHTALEKATGLPRRIVTILRKNGFASIADIQCASDDDLLAIPNIGEKTLIILRSCIPYFPRS